MAHHSAKLTDVGNTPDSVLGRVSHQLARLEKRDWELWAIMALNGILLGAGLLAVVFPSVFMHEKDVHFEITVSRELFFGLVTLLVLLNTYLITRRLELRRVREQLISTTIQSELVRLQSFTDPLTEVYNRRSLDDMAGRYISHAKRLSKPLTFMLIDVDHFKQVNTKFGHLTGDFVLAELAALLRSSVRGADAVVRYGGDEFLLILADASGKGAAQVIERINTYLHDWNRGGHLEKFEIAFSIGVCEWTDGKTLDEVLDAADQDMYLRKSSTSTQAVL